MIILDTNIVSEGLRPRPDPNVVAWIDDQPPELLFLCAPVLAELWFGVERLPEGRYRRALAAAIDHFETSLFQGRILTVDTAAARVYGRVFAGRRATGRPIGQMDALIAAIALANGAVIATRDRHGFEGVGLEIINPFDYGPAAPT